MPIVYQYVIIINILTKYRPMTLFDRIGETCSSVVRVFAHDVMDLWIDPSWCYFLFQPVLHDWCNKGRGVLSCLWDGAYKRTLAVNQKE